MEKERTCRVCGCTDNMACIGGCYWVETDLCSQCAGETISYTTEEISELERTLIEWKRAQKKIKLKSNWNEISEKIKKRPIINSVWYIIDKENNHMDISVGVWNIADQVIEEVGKL